METNVKIKRINPLFAVAFIAIPVVTALILITIAFVLIDNLGARSVISIIEVTIVVLWFTVLGGKFYKSKVSKLEAELDGMGLNRNQTFNGRGETVIVDIVGGKVAVIFYWNPFKKYIVSASKIEKAWVEDGKKGSGKREGSKRVRFCFILDGVRIDVNTFISNTRYKMTDNYILDGVSKAEHMVEALNDARANAGVSDSENADVNADAGADVGSDADVDANADTDVSADAEADADAGADANENADANAD